MYGVQCDILYVAVCIHFLGPFVFQEGMMNSEQREGGNASNIGTKNSEY
jgi:hypothetical protein